MEVLRMEILKLQDKTPHGSCEHALLTELPISKQRKALVAHHLFSNQSRAFIAVRDAIKQQNLDSLLSPKPCTVVYVGGNVNGADAPAFLRQGCTVHLLEPVPSYYEKLRRKFSRTDRVSLHNYGIGRITQTLEAPRLAGVGTSYQSMRPVQNRSSRGNLIRILSPRDMFEDLNLTHPRIDRDGATTMLHMNCEGCEYETIEALAAAHLLRHFDVIQFGTHLYPTAINGVTEIVPQYCKARKALELARFSMWQGKSFAWERWVLDKAHAPSAE
tara:strand:+ start:40 stop:858 length:819 start_codon:yes stop_codon:yes gene_type:complete